MFKKIVQLTFVLGYLTVPCSAMLKKGDHCTIISGYLAKSCDEIVIEGSCSEIFGVATIQDVARDAGCFKDNYYQEHYLAKYLSVCIQGLDHSPLVLLLCGALDFTQDIERYIKPECSGIFYYGVSPKTGEYYCLHPAWLEKNDRA